MSAANPQQHHGQHQHQHQHQQHQQHQHLEALSASVSSTPSSSVQPPELAAQQDNMMVNAMPQDPNMQGPMIGPGDVNMDGPENGGGGGYHPQHDGTSQGSLEKNGKSEGNGKTKDKRERLSRACVACHTGKTRCSDTLPCQSCVKRGIASSCAYPDPLDGAGGSTSTESAPRSRRHHTQSSVPGSASAPNSTPSGSGSAQQAGQTVFPVTPHVRGFFYDTPAAPPGQGTTYVPAAAAGPNGTVMTPLSASAAAASIAHNMRREPSPSGRPSEKARYRSLNEQELAAFSPKQYKRGTFFVGDSAPVSIDPRLPLRLLLADEERVDFFVGDGLPP